MRLVMLGPPGVGKGTQTKLLADYYRVPHISTGDILRDNARRKTGLGISAQVFMEQGHLVPDDLVIDMVDDRLQAQDCSSGFLMDGYPRTVPQALALEKFLHEHQFQIDAVINLTLTTAEIVRRLSGRRLCTGCGAIFHVEFAPSSKGNYCDKCEAELIQRKDDLPAAIEQRVEVYNENAQKLIDFYANDGRLISIQGAGSVDEIQQNIRAAIARRGQAW